MTNLEVINMLGQIVFSKSINENETTIDMSRYSSGSYIVRVSVVEKTKTFKVIKE
jgi:hypothetical protein